MSGTLGDLMLNSARYLTGEQPLQQAQTQEAYSRIPLNYSQIPLNQAQAEEARARAGYIGGPETTKTQLENQMQQIFLGKLSKAADGGNVTSGGGTSSFQDVIRGAQPAPPPAADQSSYAPPAQQPTVAAQPPAQPAAEPGSPALTNQQVTSRYGPGAFQVAQADTGTMTDVGSRALGLYSTAAEPVPPGPAGAPASTVLAQLRSGQPGAPQPQQVDPTATSDGGAFLPGVGAVPKDMEFDYWWGLKGGHNPVELKRGIMAQRFQHLATEARAASSPEDWNRRVESEWRAGWLTNEDAKAMYNRFDGREGIITSLTTASEQVNAEISRSGQYRELGPRGNLQTSPTAVGSARAGALANATGVVQVLVPDVDANGRPTGTEHMETTPNVNIDNYFKTHPGSHYPAKPPGPRSEAAPTQAQQQFAQNFMPLAQKVSDQTGIPAETVLAQAAMESGDGLRMPKNNFFGVGVYGGKAPTYNTPEEGFQAFADLYNRRYKDRTTTDRGPAAYGDTLAVAGYNPNHPGKPGVTSSYGQRIADRQNAMGLGGTQGASATPRTQYAGPGVPLEGQSDAASAARANVIVGGMVDQGANPDTLAAGRPGTRLPPGTVSTAQGGAPVISGASRPVLPYASEAGIRLDQGRIDSDYAAANDAQATARATAQQVQTLMDIKHRLPNIAAGSNTEFRNTMIRFGSTWLPQALQDDFKRYLDIDFESSKDREAAVKEFTQLALQQTAGERPGIGLAEMNAHASPHSGMPEATISDLTNAMLVRNQAIRDHAAGLQPQIEARASAWRTQIQQGKMPERYVPVQPEWEQQWNDPKGIHIPAVYQLATDAINGHSHEDLTKWYGKLTKEQRAEAEAIIRRVDPQWIPGTHQKPGGQ